MSSQLVAHKRFSQSVKPASANPALSAGAADSIYFGARQKLLDYRALDIPENQIGAYEKTERLWHEAMRGLKAKKPTGEAIWLLIERLKALGLYFAIDNAPEGQQGFRTKIYDTGNPVIIIPVDAAGKDANPAWQLVGIDHEAVHGLHLRDNLDGFL